MLQSIVYGILAVGMIVGALQAIRAPRLITAALWLAAVSMQLAVMLFLLGAPDVAVIELSVGAGLVTVLFVFAISVAGELTEDLPTIVPRPLAASLILFVIILLTYFILPAPTPAPAAETAGAPSVPEALKGGDDDSGVHATVHARRLAAELGVNLNNVNGSGRNGRVGVADIEQAIVAAGGSVAAKAPPQRIPEVNAAPVDDSKVPATSVARRLARSLGVNLHSCRPTGRHGKVCRYDVEAAHALASGASAPAAPTPEIAAETAPAVQAVPMSGMRRTIASRLQASKQTIPHYRVSMDIKLDALLALRKQINEGEPGVNVSVNDCVVKAVAMALVKCPEVNVQYDEATRSIQRFTDADISVAVAIADGLITPIVRAANTKTLGQISTEARDLATRARAGTLKADEFQGGSFSISNLGMFGVRQFDAIINPPQAAILAVAGGEQRMVVENGEPQVATVMTVSLSADHRVIDGAVAAQFLQVLKRFMETPSLMLV